MFLKVDRRESSERSSSSGLTNEIVQNGVTLVGRRDGVFCIENSQFRRIFERMVDEAEIVEQTTQRPDVHLFVDRIIVVRVQHFRRAIHRRGHFRHFILDEIAFFHRPTFVRQIDFRRCRTEIAELNETGRCQQTIFHFQIAMDDRRILSVKMFHRQTDLIVDLNHFLHFQRLRPVNDAFVQSTASAVIRDQKIFRSTERRVLRRGRSDVRNDVGIPVQFLLNQEILPSPLDRRTQKNLREKRFLERWLFSRCHPRRTDAKRTFFSSFARRIRFTFNAYSLFVFRS